MISCCWLSLFRVRSGCCLRRVLPAPYWLLLLPALVVTPLLFPPAPSFRRRCRLIAAGSLVHHRQCIMLV